MQCDITLFLELKVGSQHVLGFIQLTYCIFKTQDKVPT